MKSRNTTSVASVLEKLKIKVKNIICCSEETTEAYEFNGENKELSQQVSVENEDYSYLQAVDRGRTESTGLGFYMAPGNEEDYAPKSHRKS